MAPLPPLRSVQAFEAVARCGSVSAAAEELGVSPGAISQQIHNIEAALGVRLLERNGRALELTSWGRLYHEHVRLAFEHLRTAQDALQRERSKSGIALSAPPSLAIRWLRPLLQEWQVMHPGAGVLLVGAEEEPALADEKIDFRITYGDNVRRYDHYVELFVDSIVPVCAPSLLGPGRIRAAADILDYPLIDIEWDIQHQPPPSWSDWARAVGAEPRGSGGNLGFSLSSAAIDAAVHGGGFVLGQSSMIAEEVANGRLVIPVDHRLLMPEAYFLAWDRAIMDRPFGQKFRTFLCAAARRQTAGDSIAAV